MSGLGCYVELQEAERRNQDKKSFPIRKTNGTQAYDSRTGFSAVFRTRPVEWNAKGREREGR